MERKRENQGCHTVANAGDGLGRRGGSRAASGARGDLAHQHCAWISVGVVYPAADRHVFTVWLNGVEANVA